MQFVVYSLCSDQDYGFAAYYAIYDTFEEAQALKERICSTGYCSYGTFFVGTDEVLEEFDKYDWHDLEVKRVKVNYPLMYELLVEYNFFKELI